MAQITSRVCMKAEMDGGRHAPFWENYRPHLVVRGTEDYLGVTVVDLPQAQAVKPGASAQVSFNLVYHPEVDYSALQPETEFEIREGPRVVGYGTVITRADDQ